MQLVIRERMKKVGEAHVASRAKVVANWSTKVVFDVMVGVGPKVVQFVVYVRDKGFPRDLWKWLDKTGVKPRHNWRTKSGKPFSFPWGGPGSYQSKTDHSPARYGGPGEVKNAKQVTFMEINWPGFPPRHFSEQINKDLKPGMEREIRSGLREGLRRGKGASR